MAAERASAPAAGDHAGWAAHWGQQVLNAIFQVEVLTEVMRTGRWLGHDEHLNTEQVRSLARLQAGLSMEHAVRATRLAWMHACRKKGYKYWNSEWCAVEEAAHHERTSHP